MNVPLASRKFPLGSRGIVLAALALAILTSIAPDEASAKGGTFRLFSAFSSASAATITSPQSQTTTQATTTTTFGLLGSCGGKRYRDPNTHKCRGPGNFGN